MSYDTTPTDRPRMLDAFCCQGGATRGYQLAGWHVTGIDVIRQPNYCGDDFIQADAVQFIRDHGHEFDARHASPPCHDHSTLSALSGADGSGDLLAATRDALRAVGGPWVMENVVGADMPGSLTLCGSEFGLGATCADGVWRQLRRHRQFESNVFLMGAGGCHHKGQPIGIYGTGGGGQMTRGYKSRPGEDLEALGAPWMTRYGASQALPPEYCRFIGEQLMSAHAGLGASA